MKVQAHSILRTPMNLFNLIFVFKFWGYIVPIIIRWEGGRASQSATATPIFTCTHVYSWHWQRLFYWFLFPKARVTWQPIIVCLHVRACHDFFLFPFVLLSRNSHLTAFKTTRYIWHGNQRRPGVQSLTHISRLSTCRIDLTRQMKFSFFRTRVSARA